MNHINSPEHIAAKTAKIQASIAALTQPLAKLDRQIEALRDETESLNAGIAARDWALGAGSRPPRSTEKQPEALRIRRHLYDEQLAAVAETRALEVERVPIKHELSELQHNLTKLVRAAITPESLQSDIQALELALQRTCSQRPDLEFPLARALADRQAADDAEQADVNASEALTAGLADSFLAKDVNRNQNDAVIGQLQTDKAIAAELAGAARAARARIDKAIEQTQGRLYVFDGRITEQRKAIAAKRAERARLLALFAFNAAVECVHIALGAVCRVVPEDGKALARGLRYEGLVFLNQDNRLEAPAWLDRAFNGHQQLIGFDMLVSSEHEANVNM